MPRSGCRCRCIPAPSVIIARWGFCAKPRALSAAEPRRGRWGRGLEHSWDDPDEEKFPRHASRVRVVRVRIEQLLAVDLVIGDGLLSLRRNEPVDEGLTELLLYMRMPLGIYQHHAILIEKPLVALDRDREVAAVLERQPGAAIRQHVGVGCRRSVERRAHALPDRLVPGMPIHLDVDIGRLPEVELGDVRAGAITARDKRRALLLDGLERRNNVLAAVDAGGIALWSDQYEVVVHHRVALYAEPMATNFFSAALAWTNTTSASPRRPVSSACPVPCARTFTSMPVLVLNRGSMWLNKPESSVEVVDATTIDFSSA